MPPGVRIKHYFQTYLEGVITGWIDRQWPQQDGYKVCWDNPKHGDIYNGPFPEGTLVPILPNYNDLLKEML